MEPIETLPSYDFAKVNGLYFHFIKQLKYSIIFQLDNSTWSFLNFKILVILKSFVFKFYVFMYFICFDTVFYRYFAVYEKSKAGTILG